VLLALAAETGAPGTISKWFLMPPLTESIVPSKTTLDLAIEGSYYAESLWLVAHVDRGGFRLSADHS
jgi:hypothetical protein